VKLDGLLQLLAELINAPDGYAEVKLVSRYKPVKLGKKIKVKN
jgi:hypothetical protein